MTLRGLIKAVGRCQIDADLTLGAGGTIYDRQGRVVCTVNIKALTLQEAWAYANLFHFAAANYDAILRALDADQREGGRDG